MTEEQPNARPSSEEGVFSLEDLDKIIEAEDPNFKSQMESIKSAGVDAQIDIESIDVDGDGESTEAIQDKDRKLTKREWVAETVQRVVQTARHKIKLIFISLKNRGLTFVAGATGFIRHELPERVRYFRSGIVGFFKVTAKYCNHEYIRFKGLSRIEKTGLGFVIFASTFSFFLLSKMYTGGWLPRFSDPLIHSLEKDASFVMRYRNAVELQNLFQAFPEVEIYVLLSKVIVNLKPDENSSRNPMGIYEIYLGLDSKDTAVEVKQREREMLDMIQRALEPFSYSEVSSQVGKVRMKSAIRDQINTALNQGQAFQVYFNTFITNP